MAAGYQNRAKDKDRFNQLLTQSLDQEDRAVFLTVETSITIRATADAVWEFAYQPANWTASNPTEHFGLRFDSPDNLPHAGVTFVQHESVAGMRAALRGRFHYMDRPRLAFWTGTAAYRLLGGLLTIRLPEGGVLRMNEGPDGVEVSHDVYIDFPDSWRGRLYGWVFERLRNGRQAVYDHAFRELAYFKAQLEEGSSPIKVTDPVCGMTFALEEAVARVEYQGATYYFCAEACRKQFAAESVRYVRQVTKQ